jgi:hypothetical protein
MEGSLSFGEFHDVWEELAQSDKALTDRAALSESKTAALMEQAKANHADEAHQLSLRKASMKKEHLERLEMRLSARSGSRASSAAGSPSNRMFSMSKTDILGERTGSQ